MGLKMKFKFKFKLGKWIFAVVKEDGRWCLKIWKVFGASKF